MSEALYALLKQKKNVIKANLSKDPSASTEKAGLIRIATLVEALKGNEDNTAITPHTLKEVGDKKFGASIGLDLDPETFQLTLSLINGKGETLSSETIDLPSENALTDVDYDNDIKSLIFTYESGDTKTVSIEHVIDGLQPEITEDNKLPSDLVDDTDEQHKFVTPEEKQWLDDVNATANEVNQLHESNVTKADLEKLHSVTADANELNILDGATLTTQELNYVDGVTSSIQDQLNKKLELNSLSIKSNSTNYLGYNNTNGQISAKVDTTVTQNSTKLITSGGVQTAISNHNTSGTAHNDIRQLVSNNTSNISTINSKIPQQASSSNQLADKDFVNSSISTNTANFIGTFASVPELEAYSGTVTNNDYAFVINGVITDNDSDWATFAALNAYDKSLLTNFDYAWVINGSNFDLYRFDAINQVWDLRVQNTQKDVVTLNTAYNRHKATVSGGTVTWEFEYTLNNSSFTADQWAAINSGATAINIAQIGTNTSDITTIKNNYVPKSRTINGKALSSNINLTAGDTGALPSTTTINDLTTEAQQDALNSGATTTKINQITTNQNDIVDLKDLDGLSNTGEERLHALKGYADNGELLTDPEGLADVKKYAHSTFDRSKFTVVGSPNITDDGIASGFSASNYLTKNFSITATKSIVVKNKFNMSTVTNVSNVPHKLLSVPLVNANAISIYSGKFVTSPLIISPSVYTVTTNTNYEITEIYDIENFNYTFKLYNLDNNTLVVNESTALENTSYELSSLFLGVNNTASGQWLNGSIDLKQFSITVDGVPVFSGNKTGIDTIKPDDYTVVGTPTISADGIASGFTISNHLTAPSLNLSSTNELILETIFTAPTTAPIVPANNYNGRFEPLLNVGNMQIGVAFQDTGVFRIGAADIIDGTYKYSQENLSYDGSIYIIQGVFNLVNHTYYARSRKINTATWIQTTVSDAKESLVGTSSDSVYIGAFYNTTTSTITRAFLTASIDLNKVKIYSNGNLVYQPCLKIPYTEIKEGGKVANALYRDRVLDAYEQNLTPYSYYTLDEANQNYTLPMGNIYSLVEQRRIDNPTNISGIDAVNQYKALETGNISENRTVYPQIVERAHSTFDSSKFTVVGSPNITDDGIASGFSAEDKITFGGFKVGNGEWFLYGSFTSFSNQSNNNRILDSSSTGIDFRVNTGNTSIAWLVRANSTNMFEPRNVDISISNNVKYYYKIGYESGAYKLYIGTALNNLSLIDSYTSVTTIGNYTWTQIIGAYPMSSPDRSFNGSIDLKQFSITVDGVEVFNGNKTGIDTIKPDDYTVVGTPTISADGVASGFSSGKYLKTPIINLSTANSWEIITPWFSFSTLSGSRQEIVSADYGGSSGGILYVILNTSKKIEMRVAYTNWGGGYFAPANISIVANKKYQIKIEFTGTKYNAYYRSEDNLNWTQTSDGGLTSSTKVSLNNVIGIGATQSGNNLMTKGTIDLNSFKIYVDSNLVYQPCLKIPYTLSKTGSKIVDSIYRDRVNDMYEQFGYANYYTLDEDNGNFTLPQVELYGLIGQRTLRDSYRNGINYWELYSNRDLEQGGSCTSGVEVTFARPFADTNYVLSVPYSAKSSTAFTPTQTGDWIAKGKGIL